MATIQLQDSVYASLAAKAQAEGLSLEAYLEKLADTVSVKNGTLPRLTGEEFERLLDAEVSADSTYQGSYSRADLYLDHD
jgi:hypothetical protein